MSFEAYFDELKKGGTLDSTGVFTLNIEKLQGKLANYRLAKPREFAQFLVRAACAGGAGSISSDFTPRQSRIFIERLYFSLEQFQRFSFQVAGSGSQEAAHYVAIALSAADRLGAVRILVGRDGEGFSISSQAGELSFQESDPEAASFNGTVFSLSGQLQENPVNKLIPSARWSGVPYQPGHFELSRSDFFGKVYAAATGTRFRLPEKDLSVPVSVQFTEEEAPGLLLLFWSEHEPLSQPNVHAVHRGIAYPLPGITLPAGFHAVVEADDLKPDLSYQGLVEDEAYHAKGKMLRGLVFGLLEKVVDSPREWAVQDVRAIARKLDLYWPRSRVTDPLKRFYKRHFLFLLPQNQREVELFAKQMQCLSPDELNTIGPGFARTGSSRRKRLCGSWSWKARYAKDSTPSIETLFIVELSTSTFIKTRTPIRVRSTTYPQYKISFAWLRDAHQSPRIGCAA